MTERPFNYKQVRLIEGENAMYVNGRLMTPERYSPDDLFMALSTARDALARNIDDFYNKTRAMHPSMPVQRPSYSVMALGQDTSHSPILSEHGRKYGTGLYTDQDEIATRLHPYWDAARRAILLPEIRLFGRGNHSLLVRDTPYEP